MTSDLRLKSDLTFTSDVDARAALARAADATARGKPVALDVVAEENSGLQELLGCDRQGVDAALTEAMCLALTYPGRDLDGEAQFRVVAAVLTEFRPGLVERKGREVEFDVRHEGRPDLICRMAVPQAEAERVVRQTLGGELRQLIGVPAGLRLADFDLETVLMRFWPDAIFRYVRAAECPLEIGRAMTKDADLFATATWHVGLA